MFQRMGSRDYLDTQEIKGFWAGLAKSTTGGLDKGSKNVYDQFSRYFVRRSEFSGTPPLTLFQSTYLNSYRVVRSSSTSDTTTTHTFSYPHAPITHFVVSPLQSRVGGEYIITSRFGEFFLNSSKPYSLSLLRDLNTFDFAPGVQNQVHTLAQASNLLFSWEKDYFQDDRGVGWKDRKGAHEGAWGAAPKDGWSGTRFVGSRYDQYFLPTLLDTGLYNVEIWPNYPRVERKRHFGMYNPYAASEPEKHFFVMLTPYRNWTIFMANYPVSSSFGPSGELLSTNMNLDWVSWLIRGASYLVGKEGNHTEPTPEQMKEKHVYWNIVGKVDENRTPYGFSRGSAVNLPVTPFQEALEFIESNSPQQ